MLRGVSRRERRGGGRYCDGELLRVGVELVVVALELLVARDGRIYELLQALRPLLRHKARMRTASCVQESPGEQQEAARRAAAAAAGCGAGTGEGA